MGILGGLNSLDMPPKCTKKVKLGIKISCSLDEYSNPQIYLFMTQFSKASVAGQILLKTVLWRV